MVGDDLEQKAKEIRKLILGMLHNAGSGHPGGSLSATDILTALYFYKMRYDPKRPKWEGRDRFVLSKGHGVPVLYATLAEAGFFPKEELGTLRKLDTRLQGHSYISAPGVEATTGSLGQGLSVGNGMALAAKLDGKKYHVYVLMGDGELQEGQVWEAAMTSSHYKLDNITAIVDRNGLQQTSPTEENMALGNIKAKFESFGWTALEIDGHNIEEIKRALDWDQGGKPKAIIARTVKGKGVSFMENQVGWHGVAPNKEEYEKAITELS